MARLASWAPGCVFLRASGHLHGAPCASGLVERLGGIVERDGAHGCTWVCLSERDEAQSFI